MDDSPLHSDATGDRNGRDAPPGAPRWAKVFGLSAVAALIVAFVLMHALGGGMGGH